MSLRLFAAAALLAATSTVALAAASSVPFDYKPDPALRTASLSDLRSRIRRACAVTQARLENAAETTFNRSCGCYASRTLSALDRSELDAYRTSGIFNDTARAKAFAALDACRLRRPAV
jgi:hypothetical protein